MVDSNYLEQFRNKEIWRMLLSGFDLGVVKERIRVAECFQGDISRSGMQRSTGTAVLAGVKESVNELLGVVFLTDCSKDFYSSTYF